MTDQEKQTALSELKTRAEEYVSDKAEESVLKKRLENNNTSIKALMELLNQADIILDSGATVCYGVTKKETIDEEALIKQLKKLAPETQCIKTKEYIDMDILANEIYKGDFSDDIIEAIDACRKVKEIPTLTIKKAKKGK